jgi:hypothetical protein
MVSSTEFVAFSIPVAFVSSPDRPCVLSNEAAGHETRERDDPRDVFTQA